MTDHGTQAEHVTPKLFKTLIISWALALMVPFVIFGYFMGPGQKHSEEYYALPQIPEGGVPVDHKALIADASEAVIARGEKVYGNTCTVCHGAGATPAEGLPTARKFTVDAFKNTKGGVKSDPFAMFEVVTNGFNGGAMPPQAQLSPADRYAAIHYIRETFVKTKNPSQYVVTDDAYFAGKVLAEEKPVIDENAPHPATVAVNPLVYAVLSQKSVQAEKAVAVSELWLWSLDAATFEIALRSAVSALHDSAGTQLGRQAYESVRSGTAEQFKKLLLRPEVSALSSVFNTMSVADFAMLHTALKAHASH